MSRIVAVVLSSWCVAYPTGLGMAKGAETRSIPEGGVATPVDQATWYEPAGPALPGTPLTLYKSFTMKGSYAYDAVGMRNRGYGTAVITLPAGSTIKKAYLFWTIISKTTAEDTTFRKCKINGHALNGARLGSDYSPCWPRDGNNQCFSYRADVTNQVTNATISAYSLTGFASALTNGKDPFSSKTPLSFPMAEGATLLIFYQNNSSKQTTMQLYNGHVTVKKNGEKSILELTGFTAPSTLSAASLLFIGADGQQNADEPLSEFNGKALKGSPVWDGISADNDGEDFDEGNLWDSEKANVKPYLSPGATTAEVEVETGSDDRWDCLVWVGLVFSMTR
ncbi:MAG: DUF3344 domain-containing protein [Acidobacteria bacterium]|nr:DUF3344 domain-containing protein [Acidobacteriota bacterium]